MTDTLIRPSVIVQDTALPTHVSPKLRSLIERQVMDAACGVLVAEINGSATVPLERHDGSELELPTTVALRGLMDVYRGRFPEDDPRDLIKGASEHLSLEDPKLSEAALKASERILGIIGELETARFASEGF